MRRFLGTICAVASVMLVCAPVQAQHLDYSFGRSGQQSTPFFAPSAGGFYGYSSSYFGMHSLPLYSSHSFVSGASALTDADVAALARVLRSMDLGGGQIARGVEQPRVNSASAQAAAVSLART